MPKITYSEWTFSSLKFLKDEILYVLKDCPNYSKLNELIEVASNENIRNLIDLTNETANINSKKIHKDLKEENYTVITDDQSNIRRFQKMNENLIYSSSDLNGALRYYPNEQTMIYSTTLPKDLKEENLSVIF